MIRWCAYCQRFRGEVAPFDQFDLTHIICPACAQAGVFEDEQATAKIQPVARFFRELSSRAREGRPVPAPEVIARAEGFGITPVDLLVGLVQPALYAIGELWARQQVSVAIEHAFTSTVETLVALLAAKAAPPQPKVAPGGILLVNADGNHHTLGIRIVEFMLRSAGEAATVVYPGLPSTEVLSLVRELRPKILGVSVSLPGQMQAVRELAAAIATMPTAERPRLLVGGPAIKEGRVQEAVPGVEAIADPFVLVGAGSPPLR